MYFNMRMLIQSVVKKIKHTFIHKLFGIQVVLHHEKLNQTRYLQHLHFRDGYLDCLICLFSIYIHNQKTNIYIIILFFIGSLLIFIIITCNRHTIQNRDSIRFLSVYVKILGVTIQMTSVYCAKCTINQTYIFNKNVRYKKYCTLQTNYYIRLELFCFFIYKLI